jgi:hypothetical protein
VAYQLLCMDILRRTMSIYQITTLRWHLKFIKYLDATDLSGWAVSAITYWEVQVDG